MSLLDVVWAFLLLMATWRYSVMLINEGGPWNLLDKIRAFAEKRLKLGELFACMWCMSIWVSAGLLVLLHRAPDVAHPVIGVGALSAGALLIHYICREYLVHFYPSGFH